MRQLEKRSLIEDKEIVQLIERNDILDPNTFLVLNGGTGLGKTKQTMLNLKIALARKSGRAPRIVVVESRTNTVDQIESNYIKQIETIGGITVKQRIAFMNMIKNEEADYYDWIIIDECHGLFSEASFAEDAEFIANWIKTARKPKQHIIFITANDEYFDSIARRFFPEEYNFIYLFTDRTKYYSPTYVKKIYTIITNRMNSRIMSLLPQFKGKKGLIFFPRASQVKDWYFNMLYEGFEAAILVSQGNQTPTDLSTLQEKYLQDKMLDYSGGQTGLTMADLCEVIDAQRIKNGKKPVRQSIAYNCTIPDDIDVLITTDTLQEGISILSQIDYIVIEGYTEVEVRQKLGRYRGDLDELYLLFNPSQVTRELNENRVTFNMLMELAARNDQITLAELYGQQTIGRYSNKYIIKDKDESGQSYYRINQAMYQAFLENAKQYEGINTQDYAQNLLAPYVKNPCTDIVHLTPKDFKIINLQRQLEFIAKKWNGIPLKGEAQELLLQDFEEYEITDNGKKINTFNKCIKLFREAGIDILEKKATKQDLLRFPNYLKFAREKYKIICI